MLLRLCRDRGGTRGEDWMVKAGAIWLEKGETVQETRGLLVTVKVAAVGRRATCSALHIRKVRCRAIHGPKSTRGRLRRRRCPGGLS